LHKITTLKNGLKIVTNRMVDTHSLALGIWIKTGGRYEAKSRQGISHFMEHMLFKGTKIRSCQQLKQAIEEKGGVFNAFTSEEYVCYYVKMLSEHINLASDVLSDMVLNPGLRKDEIEKERKVIFEEIRMYLDLPMQYVHDLLDELLWPSHPLGASLLGTYDTIASMKRQDFIRQKETYHLPNNIIIVACGNIEHDNFVNVIEGLFRSEKPKSPQSFKKVIGTKGTANSTFFNKNTEQTHMCLGVRALSRQHPQRYSLALLNIILGGNMSSRLFNEIREKRSLAYEIGSSIKQYHDTGSFYIHAGVDNRKLKDAVAIMMKVLKKIKENPISKREFSMAREYYKSGLLMLLEGTMSNMLFLGEQLSSIGRVHTKEKILEELDKVTIDSINDVADKIFTNKSLRLAVIGPQSEKEAQKVEKLLKI